MKKIIYTIAFMLFYVISVSAQEDNFMIKGDFSNLKDMDSIYLQTIDLKKKDKDKMLVTFASAKIEDGKFLLKGFVEWEDEYNVLVKKSKAPKEDGIRGKLFVEKGTLSYSGEFGRYPVYSVKGSKYANKMYSYHTNKEYLDLRSQILEMESVENPTDEHKINIQKVSEKIYPLLSKNDPNWFEESHPSHHLILANKYLYSQEIVKFIEEINYLEEKYPTHPQVILLANIKPMFEEQLQKKKDGMERKSRVGTQFKDMVATTPDGKKINLSEVLKTNKLVLLDFWASWCGPCRGEFPHLRLAYKEYKKKGFEIFAVSLDEKNSKWRKALDVEKTTWINTVDLAAFKSEGAIKYNVRGIPYNVLINNKGEIVGESLRGEELDQKLEELLNN